MDDYRIESSLNVFNAEYSTADVIVLTEHVKCPIAFLGVQI